MSWLGIALIVIGLFFLVVGSIGMLRLPDVFSRAHALSVTDSLGALFVLLGLAVYEGFNTNFLRIIVVLGLIYLLNPVIAHATVRAAYRSGLRPGKGDDQ
ncbi:MAG: monovalent cation/H(+) antiporter subunit G [Gammaproteobacteria bacterium]|nr:monovalent cation/H(+) antiporter subunit G [Gammaproteobacteria bacterium]MDH3506508.1 monovalent cation/H(+) antiporter subunit G [Gammaproteobacteria bacterium]